MNYPCLRTLAELGVGGSRGAVAVAAGVTAYLAWPARRSSASLRGRQSLIAYLRDHLSGSDVALRVVHRLSATHQGTEDGTWCRDARRPGHRRPGQAMPLASVADLRGLPPTVDGVNFVELEAKAVRQWEAIEERRRVLAVQTFSVPGARAE